MTSEARKFFDNRFGGLNAIVRKGKQRGLHPECVKRAAEMVYELHLVKPLQSSVIIGQRIFAMAKTLPEPPELEAQKKSLFCQIISTMKGMMNKWLASYTRNLPSVERGLP